MSLALGCSHDIVALDKLVDELKALMAPLKQKVAEKDALISDLVKTTSVVLSMWDNKTEEMVKQLRRTRDEQVWFPASVLSHYIALLSHKKRQIHRQKDQQLDSWAFCVLHAAKLTPSRDLCLKTV